MADIKYKLPKAHSNIEPSNVDKDARDEVNSEYDSIDPSNKSEAKLADAGIFVDIDARLDWKVLKPQQIVFPFAEKIRQNYLMGNGRMEELCIRSETPVQYDA